MSIPLLPSNSEPQPKIVAGLNSAIKHANERDHACNVDTKKGDVLSQEWKKKCENDTKLKHNNEILPHHDLAAMSVLSLLDSKIEQDREMDTDRDLEEQIVLNSMPIETDKNQTWTCTPTCEVDNFTPRKKSYYECPVPTIYFRDGKRSVDFVLVWDSLAPEATTEAAQSKRKTFEDNLHKEGLEIEYEPIERNGLQFLKIHAPKEVLRRYGEILKLRMPMKEILGKQAEMRTRTNFVVEGFNTQCKKLKSFISIDTDKFPEKGHRFTAIYSRDREYLFDVDSPCFFTPAIHSRIVQFILDRKRFTESHEDDFAFGIERLLNEKVYSAAYPLHDGDLNQAGSMRKLLHTGWASVRKWYRYQPLDYVKEYFGVKIALYFAWLGFYTHMLLPASIVGLMCFIYSCITMHTHNPSEDICNSNLNITMCPQCDHFCGYWNLSTACTQARITYLFDNYTTVFFAIFMSIWGAIFLEFWKRYSAEITHRWDLTGFDVQEEHPRPQYLARLSHVKRKHINIITNTMEPHVPFWRMRVPFKMFSFSTVLLLVALAFAAVIGVVFYRMTLLVILGKQGYGNNERTSTYAMILTNVTAAIINLCCIVVFNWIYSYVAEYLTEMELIRTQTEFDDSLALKIYLLQFVNYYASIFYIAFFKGQFVGHPKKYNKIYGSRQEECALGGCLLELCIQLSIIMVGKQALNSVLEMSFPLFFKWMNTLKVKTRLDKDQASMKTKAQWMKDFKLVEWGPRSLFPEYLEMVLQYGFVTVFVAAFPPAPFFALLNNILEMRLDARKLLTYYKRPVSQRVRDIGVWYRILDSIGKLAVITNGFIIAFTSTFIPRLVYRLENNFSLTGYLNHSLSVFQVNNETQCRYFDYREPPGMNQYELTQFYWKVLAARLAFVVLFENAVALVIILVKWLIPDIPGKLNEQIRRETFITNEIIIKQEALRAKLSSFPDGSPPIVRQMTLGVGACPTNPSEWDQIIDR